MTERQAVGVPVYQEYMNPVLEALRSQGQALPIEEVDAGRQGPWHREGGRGLLLPAQRRSVSPSTSRGVAARWGLANP